VPDVERVPVRHGDLELLLSFEPIEGRMECVGIEVRATRTKSSEPRALTTLDLRLPLATIVNKARKKYTDFVFADTGDEWDETPWASGQVEQWEPKKIGRPPIYGLDHFADVARAYREAYVDGKTPTRAVARQFKASEAAAAKWVAKCRALGLLPATTQGKARSVEPKKTRRKRR
jgi:hypothetical protein